MELPVIMRYCGAVRTFFRVEPPCNAAAARQTHHTTAVSLLPFSLIMSLPETAVLDIPSLPVLVA